MRRAAIGLLFLLGVPSGWELSAGQQRDGDSGTPQSQHAALAESADIDAESSPLISAVYQASREKKVKRSLEHIQQAKELIQQGADVKARGDQGRTALHWAIIGSNSAKGEKHRQAYLELAELLIDSDADVNAEDDQGNTALDWEQVDTIEAFHHLLLEAGAESGSSQDESERMIAYVNRLRSLSDEEDFEALRAALDADLPAGTEIPIRLTTRLASTESKGGDRVEAHVIAPVSNGHEVVIGPGAKVEGVVMTGSPASSKYSRAELFLDFGNLLHPDGAKTRFVTRLAEVGNARESVNSGRILGIAFPHSIVTKWNWGLKGLGLFTPGVATGFQWATKAYGRTLKREIIYDPGVEMTLRVTVPERLETTTSYEPWKEISLSKELVGLVNSQPLRVHTPSDIPSDITNLMFIGSHEDLEEAFKAAGWVEAASLGVRTGLKTFTAIMRKNGYDRAPFSLLLLEGSKPVYEYQKSLNTFAKRHHLRVFNRPLKYNSQQVWVASATHDIGIGIRKKGTDWHHIIDSRIDRERTKIANDLLFTGIATAHALVDRPQAPRDTTNGTGDRIRTDGKMQVLFFY